MKLLYYGPGGHPNNKRGIELMCAARGIHYEFCESKERFQIGDYDILISAMCYTDPDSLPPHIKLIIGPQIWINAFYGLKGPYNPNYEKKCAYNSLSLWNAGFVNETVGELRTPIAQFPFAVDVDRFRPQIKQIEFDCLVYQKRRLRSTIDSVIGTLNEKGVSYREIGYGGYNEEGYLELLNRCKFMICLDAHESQGFALEEAMSCNIPLLVLDATTMYDESCDGYTATYEYLRPRKLSSTSVPYWSDTCGIKITDTAELPTALDTMLRTYESFTPRDYVVKTLSPTACMDRILDYFELSVEK